jgi:hypothetical protein
MEAPDGALVPTPVLVCRLCDVQFKTAQEKREHAKSEWQ